jgi:addiction module RelE/StbE family toxin
VVIWSKPAKNDLKRIHNYIAQDSNYYANEVVHVIIEKTKLLESFTRMGRPVPEIRDENILEILVYSYRIIYEISNTDILILTIIHSKMDFNKDDLPKT